MNKEDLLKEVEEVKTHLEWNGDADIDRILEILSIIISKLPEDS